MTPGTDLSIGACDAKDLPAVLELWATARSAQARTPDSIDVLERLLEHAPDCLLVAKRGSAVTGTLIAAWDGWRGNLYRLAVAPSERRRGVARALVAAAERQLRAKGARRVTALVAHDDGDANRLWEAAGYPKDGWVGRRVRSL